MVWQDYGEELDTKDTIIGSGKESSITRQAKWTLKCPYLKARV